MVRPIHNTIGRKVRFVSGRTKEAAIVKDRFGSIALIDTRSGERQLLALNRRHPIDKDFAMTLDDDAGHERKVSQLIQLLERLDDDPSIENYIALRRFAPGCDTEISRFTGVDPLQVLGQELENAGLDRWIVCGALSGDDRDIDELCLQLMERLIERKSLEAQGETHLQSRGKGVSDALIGYLIVAMIEALQQHGLEPKPSLVLLVKEQLGGANTDIYKSHKKWEGANRAIFLGMQLRRRGVEPTIRQIAELMGVQPSTVSRWFPRRDFLKQVDNFEKSFVKFRDDPSETQ